MLIQLGIVDLSIFAVLLGAFQFLWTLWISERFKASLQKANAMFLENFRWEMKIREQAAKVAEYFALSSTLTESSSQEDYRKANQLVWELMMWLPTDICKSIGTALKSNDHVKICSVLLAVRKILLKDAAGDVSGQDFVLHAPGIGKKQI